MPKATANVPLTGQGLGKRMYFGDIKGNQARALKRVPYQPP